MRLILMLATACVACHGGSEKPHATGRLVFDTKPANEADTFLATEAEVLRSSPVLHRVQEEHRQTTEIDPSAISVARYPDTMILDVTVTDRDPRAAVEICNRVLEAYLNQRLEMAIMRIQERMQVLSQGLEASPNNPDLQRQLQELDIQQHLRQRDVRVLEVCTAPAPK